MIKSDFKEAIMPWVFAAVILGIVALGHLVGVTYEEALYDEPDYVIEREALEDYMNSFRD